MKGQYALGLIFTLCLALLFATTTSAEVTNVTHPSCTYDPGGNVATISCESGHVSNSGDAIAAH